MVDSVVSFGLCTVSSTVMLTSVTYLDDFDAPLEMLDPVKLYVVAQTLALMWI
jgi:hypothetical protein